MGTFQLAASSLAMFSGLRKAYDSLGAEISRTFDSSPTEKDKSIPNPEIQSRERSDADVSSN